MIPAAPEDLTPARVAQFLNTRTLGKSIRCLEETTSTSDEVHRDALNGAPHGHVVTAESQTAGRGRKGRRWLAPRGVNLSFSILLRPNLAAEQVPSLTLCAAVGCREALLELGADSGALRIKWPNDLNHQGRKLAGILSEMTLGKGRSVNHAVIGIGMNVNLDTALLPPPLNEEAVSLRNILGHEVDRALLLARLLFHLENAFEAGFSRVEEKYREGSSTLGQRVRAMMENETIEGLAEDLTPRGALLIRRDDGGLTEVQAGDVVHLR